MMANNGFKEELRPPLLMHAWNPHPVPIEEQNEAGPSPTAQVTLIGSELREMGTVTMPSLPLAPPASIGKQWHKWIEWPKRGEH